MNSAHGFTMIELIMVIVILGVLAAYAVPKMDLQMFDAHVAAQELVEAIRYAQEMSMTHSGSTPFQVDLDAAANSYAVTHNGVSVSSPLSGDLNYVSDWSNVVIDRSGTIAFDSLGKPVCSGGLAACSEPTESDISIAVAVGSDSITVAVERMTGYARLN